MADPILLRAATQVVAAASPNAAPVAAAPRSTGPVFKNPKATHVVAHTRVGPYPQGAEIAQSDAPGSDLDRLVEVGALTLKAGK